MNRTVLAALVALLVIAPPATAKSLRAKLRAATITQCKAGPPGPSFFIAGAVRVVKVGPPNEYGTRYAHTTCVRQDTNRDYCDWFWFFREEPRRAVGVDPWSWTMTCNAWGDA